MLDSNIDKSRALKHELTGAFKHERDGVALVFCLQGDDVIIPSTLEHFGHVLQVDAKREVPVTAVVIEASVFEKKGDECNMAGVHGLECNPRLRAVKVSVCNQVLDGFKDLLEQGTLQKPTLKHLDRL
jgi:hypothetical protein